MSKKQAVVAFIRRVYWFRILLVLTAICILDILFQLGLPTNTTSSNARLGENNIVSMKASDIEHMLSVYEDSSYIYIKVGDEQYIKKFKDVGITIDIDKAKTLANYGLSKKLIPFSALYRFTNSYHDLPLIYNSETARPFIEEIAAYGNVEPEPARLIANNGQVGVVADVPGTNVDVEDALQALGHVEYVDRIEFYADQYAVRSELTEAKASEFANQANQFIKTPPVFELDGQVVNVAPTNMADWFNIEQVNSKYQLALNQDAVGEYLDQVAHELFVPSVGTKVTLLDGQETTRVNGVAGKVLDKQKALADIEAALSKGDVGQSIDLRLTDVTPGVTYERTYSRTISGLKVFVADTAARGNFYVSLVGIDNPSMKAEYRGGTSITAASTYKVYVAYYIMREIEQGRAEWSDKLPSGRQVESCMEDMIVVSSNSCGIELRDYFGISKINNQLRAIGLPKAQVGPAQTSADDLSNFFYKLTTQNILSSTNRDKLIDMLKRQIHRLAIPAGVAPTPVADKGGFYGTYNHDTGIVYATNGRYALTIMSAGGYSKADLANLARDIHNFVIKL